MSARPDKSPLVALDANGNATAPSLPTVPTVAAPKEPVAPDPLVKFFPKNIPDWFLITYTYSVVLIFILLIANVTPDGKLYIHFTAFWSLILYFVLEDEQVHTKSLDIYLSDVIYVLRLKIPDICFNSYVFRAQIYWIRLWKGS